MPKGRFALDAALAREAKSLVALAFRKGPIEHVHAGRECPKPFKLRSICINVPQSTETSVSYML